MDKRDLIDQLWPEIREVVKSEIDRDCRYGRPAAVALWTLEQARREGMFQRTQTRRRALRCARRIAWDWRLI